MKNYFEIIFLSLFILQLTNACNTSESKTNENKKSGQNINKTISKKITMLN